MRAGGGNQGVAQVMSFGSALAGHCGRDCVLEVETAAGGDCGMRDFPRRGRDGLVEEFARPFDAVLGAPIGAVARRSSATNRPVLDARRIGW